MTRLAIIADTHMPRGARRIPDRCIELMREADAILHAGDFNRLEVLEEIRRLGPPVVGVHGNNDDTDLRQVLPHSVQVDFDGVTIAMTHDGGPRMGRLNRLRRRFPAANAVVFGHSHLPDHAELDGFQIFNPGSPTERRRAPVTTMGFAHIARGRVTFDLVTL